MSKVWIVAQHDFLATVRRKSFVLVTLGMPIVFGVMALLAAAPTYLMLRVHRPTAKRVHVVDRTGKLLSAKSDAQKQLERRVAHIYRTQGQQAAQPEALRLVALKLQSPLRLYRDEAVARQRLNDGAIDVYYVVSADYVKTASVSAFTRPDTPMWVSNLGIKALRNALIDGLLRDRSRRQIVDRVKRPIDLETFAVAPTGRVARRRPLASLFQNGLPYGFGVLLMLCIFMTSGRLLQSLTEERSSRILELLLSSVTPRQLLVGKLIGLGGAGFFQFLLWLSLGIVPLLAFTSLVIGLGTLLLMIAYFLLGFVLFGSLTFAVACVASASKEGQHLASAWSILAALPLMVSPLIVKAPHSLLARALSFFPFTSPVTMILRVASASGLWVDIAASLLVLAGSIVVLIAAASGLLRLSLMTTGKLPSSRQLWQAAIGRG